MKQIEILHCMRFGICWFLTPLGRNIQSRRNAYQEHRLLLLFETRDPEHELQLRHDATLLSSSAAQRFCSFALAVERLT